MNPILWHFILKVKEKMPLKYFGNPPPDMSFEKTSSILLRFAIVLKYGDQTKRWQPQNSLNECPSLLLKTQIIND